MSLSEDMACKNCDGSGWLFAELDGHPLASPQIEHCMICERFDTDREACQHLAWLIVQAMGGCRHLDLTRLMVKGGKPHEWEELDQ